MKKNWKIAVLVLLFAVASCSFTTNKFDGPDKDEVLIELITFVLQKGHYDAKEIDDSFSSEVYKDFLNAVDSRKRFFLKSDIKEFKEYENLIDDQIHNQEIEFFNLIYNRLMHRMDEVESVYGSLLEKPFDFSKNETINADYEEMDYASSKEELKERWRKQLKFSTLATYHDKHLELEQESENNSKKSDIELEKEAREVTKNSLDEYFDFSDDLTRKDWFSLYINSIVEQFDPHTFYFAPDDKEKFDVAMSGKLEGIGARLQKKDDNVKIVEVISGGPAWRGEELEVGDVILKVRQEDEEKAVSIVGMRLDDAVNLIKGPKGTIVNLTVKKVDGTIEDISIVRDVVEIEETYAKSSMVEKNGKKFGLINLPKFYFDMNDYDNRNAASDIEKEIIRLKKEGMEGLVLDLRNNGGGSLKTVVDIAGLFIEKGPIVQIKSQDGAKEILNDTDKSILWNGPLVILVNELSASASEILAAAMQDYKRAIIIGSKQTYGKGTVQNVIDLNRWMRNNELGDMGALKLTTQKFYRVNGGSTQLEGVKSDVIVPDKYSFIDIGEKDQSNPLPWDQIEAVDYQTWDGYIDYEETISNSKMRMKNNHQLSLIAENAKWIKDQTEESVFPLNYELYKKEVSENEAQAEKFEAISEYDNNLTFVSLPYEIELFQQDSTLAEKRNRWHKNLSGDVYVEEAINVLEDLKMNNIKKSKMANVRN
ncbi:MAG TPA: carboxy terminal-processing peptidase [Salinimicrobium sp.]|nr:carboxy terminal-processing peptidase [Salinimicrobium sp.]